jgi:hypothetical protein
MSNPLHYQLGGKLSSFCLVAEYAVL